MKKILSLLLVLMLTLGLVGTAWAEVATSQTIATPGEAGAAANAQGKYTISVASTDTHTYKVFQVLTGTLIAGESQLGNPAWGSNAISEPGDVNTFINSIKDLSGVQLAEKVAEKVNTNGTPVATISAGTNALVVPVIT